MNNILAIVLFSSAAGLPIILGGSAASIVERRQKRKDTTVNRWVIAFGGGALGSAIAFALVPRAIELLPAYGLVFIFLAGTACFMTADILIARSGSSMAQVLSMMMDFIPEALALGASFAHDRRFGLLLAIFIGLQNLPEGFNSYFELRRGKEKKAVLLLMGALSTIGIFAAVGGYLILSERPALIASIMLFAAGGIVYLIFQDIAPLSRKENDWVPATGGSIGFLLGMVGGNCFCDEQMGNTEQIPSCKAIPEYPATDD